MAQIIAPSVQLQLDDQYNQHYDSAINVPFQINPANELKPLGVMAEAFAQYENKLAESESNIEAQTALNKFNEYKAQRLTDLAQMPVGKAVDAYKGLDNDLQNYAKICGQNITSPKAKNKFDISAGSAVSDGKIRGYALHAEQVTKQEANVDAAAIDTASQAAASSVGTPTFHQDVQNFMGVVDANADKYGFTPEEKLSYKREQTKKLYVNAGETLITTKEFSKCAQMLQEEKENMDTYTYNDINSKLKAAMEVDAKRKAAEAREKRSQEMSEISMVFSAAKEAKDYKTANNCAEKMKAYRPELASVWGEQVALGQAGLLNNTIKDNITIGRDSQSEINELTHVLPNVAPEARAAFIGDIFIAGDKQTALTQQAEAQALKSRLEREEKQYNKAIEVNQLDKAADHAARILIDDPERADLLFDGIAKEQQDAFKAALKERLTSNEKELNKWLEAEDWDKSYDRILDIAKDKPNYAKALLAALNKKQKDSIETVRTKRVTALEAGFNTRLEAGDLDGAYEKYKQIASLNSEKAEDLRVKLNKKQQDLSTTALDNQKKRYEKIINNYAEGKDYKTVAKYLGQYEQLDKEMKDALVSKFSKQQLDEIERARTKEVQRITSLYDESLKSNTWKDAGNYLNELAQYDPEAAQAKWKTLTKLQKDKIIADNKERYKEVAALYDEHVKANKPDLAIKDLAEMAKVNYAMADAKALTLDKTQKDLQEKERAKQAAKYTSLFEDHMKAGKLDKAADSLVALSVHDPDAAKAKYDQITKAQSDKEQKLKKEMLTRYQSLIEHYAKGKDYDSINQQLENVNKIDHELALALQSEVSKAHADYATSTIDLGVQTNNQALQQRGVTEYAKAEVGLTETEKARQLTQRQNSVGSQLLKQAEKYSTKNVALASNICQQIINTPSADQASKDAAKQMLGQFDIDKVFTQAEALVQTKNFRDLGSALYTTDANGKRVYSELAKRMYEANPDKFTDIVTGYENGNIKAEEERVENIKKNRGLPDEEQRTEYDRYVSSRLDGENGMVAVYMTEHGVKNPTEYQRQTIRNKLEQEIKTQAWQHVEQVNNEVWEKNTAEGARFMSTYKAAQAIYDNTIMKSQEARHRALTSTNAFSQLPQKDQNELLKVFGGDKEKEQEFISYFNGMNKNHAEGNPQAYQRVLLDIKANKYIDSDPYTAMKKIGIDNSDLSPEQLNQIDKELKEHELTLKGQTINSFNSQLKDFFTQHLKYGSKFSKLEAGSPEERAVMTAVAKVQAELDRRLGFNGNIDSYQREFAVLLRDEKMMQQIHTSVLQAKTQADFADNLADRVEDASLQLNEAEARGVQGSYSLEASAERRSFHYPFTFAGIQEYIRDARALGSDKVANRKAKAFVEKYFTDEEKKQYEIDKAVWIKKISDQY